MNLFRQIETLVSGKKKEPKPKLFGPDIFQWGRGLPRERVGAKKFDMSLETQGIKLFGWDIPGFCRDIPEAPEKFEKKKVRVQFPFPIVVSITRGWLRQLKRHNRSLKVSGKVTGES